MNKNLNIEVPKDAETEVVNKKSLRTNVFTRTRIAALSLILVMALAAVGGTQAYIQWTANQTPDRGTSARISIRIGEKASLTADAVYDTNGNYSLGTDKKVVFVEAGSGPTELEGTVTVSVIPQAESKTFSDNNAQLVSDGYQTFSQEWSALKQETIDGTTWDYIETSLMKVYLAQGWDEHWTFQKNNGIFKYNETLKSGEKTSDLISGVVLQDTVNKDTYKNIKLSVLAQTVQAS